MKLVRYGNQGQEKPGLVDADGQLRDLSGHVADINGPALSKDSLKMLYGIDPASLPAVSGTPGLEPVLVILENSCVSALIILITLPRQVQTFLNIPFCS